jgi:hypothetical protein
MDGGQDQTFYDISLVDGYNLPMAIVLMNNNVDELKNIQAKRTNPSCVGSVGNLAPQSFNPYSGSQQFLGTTSSAPMDFDKSVSSKDVAEWCPWDLQTQPPSKPGNGVYPYPDSNIARPAFAPCLSACKKYNKAQYCCTGQYVEPGKCSPDYYASSAKKVCPDAYSFAQDDQTSTFIVPKGASYQVIFCPGGRSTNIIASHDKYVRLAVDVLYRADTELQTRRHHQQGINRPTICLCGGRVFDWRHCMGRKGLVWNLDGGFRHLGSGNLVGSHCRRCCARSVHTR